MSDSEKGEEGPETLVAGRPKRTTAGNRMARLLNQEEGSDDEFYKEYYGENVFLEDDSEFTTEEESEESDEFDSDFFTEDEEEQQAPEEVEDTVKAKRRRNVYVDPLKKAAKKAKTTARKSKAAKPPKRPPSSSPSAAGGRAPHLDRELKNLASSTGFRDKVEILSEKESESTRRRSRRRAVVKRLEKTKREKKKKTKKASQSRKASQERPKPTRRKMTLAERLVEAVETERQNMASLQEFYKTNEERKRAASKLKTFNGPRVRYHSFTTKDSEGKPRSRSVVSFSDEDTLKSAFDPRRAVDTRPFFTASDFLPPDPPLSGLGVEQDGERERSDSDMHPPLYPEHVGPHMNIFKTLGFGR